MLCKPIICSIKPRAAVSKLRPVIEAVQELESLFVSTPLDVEFAVDGKGTVYILQVRPLVLRGAPADLGQQAETLGRIYQKVESGQRVKPYLHGKRTIYGVMPDWNPAEIIGVRPRPLALSLYKRLVTDGVWAYQRNNYGYKNLRSFPLMIDFAGFRILIRASASIRLSQEILTTISVKSWRITIWTVWSVSRTSMTKWNLTLFFRVTPLICPSGYKRCAHMDFRTRSWRRSKRLCLR